MAVFLGSSSSSLSDGDILILIVVVPEILFQDLVWYPQSADQTHARERIRETTQSIFLFLNWSEKHKYEKNEK